MDTLIAVGTTAAYGHSLATILAPGFFRAAGLGDADGALPLGARILGLDGAIHEMSAPGADGGAT